jgi:hypothetical protein
MSVSKPQGPRRPITRLAAMLGRTRIALLAGVLTIGIAGCGGDDGTIPQSQSEQLLNILASLQNQVDDGNCAVAESTVQQLNSAIKDLPSSVDTKVKDALERGTANLSDLTQDPQKCTSASGATGASSVETTDSTSSSTSTTTPDTTTGPETTTDETSTPADTGEQPSSGTPPVHETPPTGDNQGPLGGNQTGGGPRTGGVTIPGGKR